MLKCPKLKGGRSSKLAILAVLDWESRPGHEPGPTKVSRRQKLQEEPSLGQEKRARD